MKWRYMEIVAAATAAMLHTLSHKYVTQCPAGDILKACKYTNRNLRNLVPDFLGNSTTDSNDMAVSEPMIF